MINVTKLYCGIDDVSDKLRYSHKKYASRSVLDIKPIVVWNITNKCNLKCVHCYSNSKNKSYKNELSTLEAKKVISDLAFFKTPFILFSGGEPLLRHDIFTLASYAKKLGLKFVLSTNGTLIDKKTARKIKKLNFSYVGISLDGIGEINDVFRGKKGAFKKIVQAFKNCIEIGQKTGLRLTLTKQNFKQLPKIFDFIEENNIPRACFYHLVPSGRGRQILKDILTPNQTRLAIDIILKRARDFAVRGIYKEILTVDNHADGPYIYLKLKHEKSPDAEKTLRFLEDNGGGLYSSGVGIGCIDHKGDVHPDQFWQNYTLGNVKEKKFSEIWVDTTDKLMAGMKNRIPLLKGRCAQCKWINMCGGSLRIRAKIKYNDAWAQDPACYLTDREISTAYSVRRTATSP